MYEVSSFHCMIWRSTNTKSSRRVRYSFTQNHKEMLANDCFAGEEPGIYSNPARHSACVNEIIIMNCEGSSSNYSSMITGSTFRHWFKAALRDIASCSRWSRTWKKYFLAVGIVSTVMRMPQKRTDDGYHHSSPWIRPLLWRVRRRGHVISFHSPVMSTLLHATNTPSKTGKQHAILRP
jgi:hypothetical protein